LGLVLYTQKLKEEWEPFGTVVLQSRLSWLYTDASILAPYAVAFFCYILFANLWQFITSAIHFQCNSLVTTLLANMEWQNYGIKKRSLRVSSPVGLQRSTYFISLPWKYGLPQMMAVSFLHWTLSQSVFAVPVEMYSSDGSFSGRFTTMGYSFWPIVTCK